ncbi:MAG: TIGR03862 family flavoprotein [Pseudomonadota bacterium]
MRAAVIGGGPAGLMAAEVLSERGVSVTVYDGMPSLGRKFLMAGKSGLNISKDEPLPAFQKRYLRSDARLVAAVDAFGPEAIRAWMQDLGITVRQGSGGRMFPLEMKASPLLRAWLRRLDERGVVIKLRHRWAGWSEDGELGFTAPNGQVSVSPDVTVFALGGASWSRLGSDGAWADDFAAVGVGLAPFEPSNGGCLVPWSDHIKEHFAGTPVKATRLTVDGPQNRLMSRGEWTITARGMEGGGIYEVSSAIRDSIQRYGNAKVAVDLLPDTDRDKIQERLTQPRGKQSLSNHLRKRVRLSGVKAALLREFAAAEVFNDPARLAGTIKALPITVKETAPMDEAISTAGGVPWSALDAGFMLRSRPGTFCAGEMIDWDAPTGGYLLTACLATGRRAGEAAAAWVLA